jgi:CubicO group peptidase (beta-lactamase class C family)
MKRKSLYVIIVIWCLIHVVYGQQQELPTAKPEEIGLSSGRLERLNTIIQGHVDQGELAGTVILIARRGKIGHFKTYGYIDIEAKKAMPHDAIFPMASMTKIITSAAALILYEEGYFLLSDPVSRYIPEFKDMKVVVPSEKGQTTKNTPTTVPAEREITIRDLLRHTAGFTYGYRNGTVVDQMYRDAGFRTWNRSLAGFVKQLAKFPLEYQPGERWKYSYSTDVLGYLVEIVSGQPLDTFLKQRVYEPLGMKDSGFYVPKDKLNRLSNHYKYEQGSLHLEESAVQSEFRKRPSALSAGGGWGNGYGGLVITAPDFARFLQMILNRGKLGKHRMLSRKSIELMTANHMKGLPGGFGPGFGYGLGVGTVTDLGDFGSLGSTGAIFWAGAPYNTYFYLDFKEEMFLMLLTQTAPWGYLDIMDPTAIKKIGAHRTHRKH